MHSTRLYPTGSGANSYQLSGIASRCDWIVLSDWHPPHTVLLEQRRGDSPRHVFLSMRDSFSALAFFRTDVLPRIKDTFRLISGSEDHTIPQQQDQRWREFNTEEEQTIQAILEDPRLLSWSAENLVATTHPKWMPLPLGLLPEGPWRDLHLRPPTVPKQACRPVRILCAHRLREHPQWDLRRRLTALCRQELSAWTTLVEEEIPLQRFEQMLRMHAFVICAAGGGIDPSPKAWHALLQGTIPIVRHSALDRAYRQLPVVFVKDWSAAELSWDRLCRWQQQLMPWFDQPERRIEILHRLSLDYWWEIIHQFQPGQAEPATWQLRSLAA